MRQHRRNNSAIMGPAPGYCGKPARFLPGRLFILSILLVLSCNKDENRIYNITISGTVTDEVSGLPVAGAEVLCGVQRGVMPGDDVIYPTRTTVTGSDGWYSLSIRSESVSDISSIPIGSRGNSIALTVRKEGFAGSNRAEIYYYNAHGQAIDFKLFHYAQLNLKIMNDTIKNNIDTVIVEIYKYRAVNPQMVFRQICGGRKLDTTLVIDKLYGNWEYTLKLLYSKPYIEYTIIPKADITTYYNTTF